MSKPLLLLHPLGSDRSYWDTITSRLPGREVLAPDLPGHGNGQPLPPDPGVDDLVAAVLADLDARGIGRVDVVGVSLGGLVAQRLAARHPARVRRLAVVDALVSYPGPMKTVLRKRSASARAQGTAGLVEGTLSNWFTDQFIRDAPATVDRVAQVLERIPGEQYARSCELLASVDLTDDVPLIQAPALVVCGDKDGPAFVAAAKEFGSTLRNVRVEWLDGKHAAVLERPAAFVGVLTAFLDATDELVEAQRAPDRGGA